MSKIEVVFFDLGETLVTSGRQWIAGAKKTVLDLDQLGIRLGVISNTGDLSRQQILQLLPIDLDLGIFESSLVVFSSEVGIEKPDPGIFTLALERTGIEAGKCLFCTENLVDTLAAQQIGMRAARVLPPPASDIADLIKNIRTAGLLT